MAQLQCPVDPTSPPDQFNFATHVVDYWAATAPAQAALHWVDQSLTTERRFTYSYFAKQSHRIAHLLASHGVKQGDVCIVILPRIPEWWAIATACLRAGIVMCPCTTLLVDKDIEYRVQVSGAVAFIGDEISVAKLQKVRKNCSTLRTVFQIDEESSSSLKSLAKTGVVSFAQSLSRIPEQTCFEVPHSLQPNSAALIFFTSGTTGPPKMVLHSHISYPLAHALTGAYWLQLGTSSLYWNLSEQGWAKAAYSFFAAWNLGATLFVHDDRQAFDARKTLAVLAKYPITTLCAPPTVYRQLVLDDHKPLFKRVKALKHATGAGEPLNANVIEKWRELLDMTIYDGFGQTETIVLCANQAMNPVRYGSMGKPLPGVPLILIDPDGNEASAGAEGDLAIEVRENATGFFGIFQGYINRQTGALDRRLKRYPNGKLFYLCGDRATRDEDNYFWFVGRGDDVINSAGYRIGKGRWISLLTLYMCCSCHPRRRLADALASPPQDLLKSNPLSSSIPASWNLPSWPLPIPSETR